MSEGFAERESPMEVKQGIAEDLVGDRRCAAGPAPDHLQYRSQPAVMVPGNRARPFGPVVEGASVPRQHEHWIELLEPAERTQEIVQRIFRPLADIDVRRDRAQEMIA